MSAMTAPARYSPRASEPTIASSAMRSTPASRRTIPRTTAIVRGMPPISVVRIARDVGRTVAAGDREHDPGQEADRGEREPDPVEVEAPGDHGCLRSAPRRWMLISVRSVAMSTS